MQKIFNAKEFWDKAIAVDPKFLAALNKCLVLAPHPDDESLGCGGLISYLTSHDKQVKVIFTTDGSASHPNSKEYPKEKLSALRKKEAIEALQTLGVEADQISFYNGKDSGLEAKGEEGFSKYVELLHRDIIDFKPELILVPYELDPHRDHRATWQMLIAATGDLKGNVPIIWEYPIWLYENAAIEDLPFLKAGELKALDISNYIAQKKVAISIHRSQTTDLISDDPSGFRLLPEMIANFTEAGGMEYFLQRATLNLGSTLSQAYFDQIYQNDDDPWSFETSEYEKSKYQHTLKSLPAGHYSSGLEIGCSIGVLTEMLIPYLDSLIAIDLSEKALEVAKTRLAGNPNIEFRLAGIPNNFPEGNFDLIVMSEVGYYLSLGDLKKTVGLIEKQLTKGGTLIIVHWTHYVVDYPLSGDEVHECFSDSELIHLHGDRTKDYRLDVYKKK